MSEKQPTFNDLQTGEKCICFDSKVSLLDRTIPVIIKIPETNTDDDKQCNVVFMTGGQFAWVEPDMLIVRVR